MSGEPRVIDDAEHEVTELFGLMALTTAIGVVVSLLADIGIRQAVVQSKRGDSPEMLDTAWTMQIIRGVLIWLVCIVIAFVLDRLQVNGVLASDSVYGSPQLPMVIVAVTFSIVISGFASTKLLIADRSLDRLDQLTQRGGLAFAEIKHVAELPLVAQAGRRVTMIDGVFVNQAVDGARCDARLHVRRQVVEQLRREPAGDAHPRDVLGRLQVDRHLRPRVTHAAAR